MKPSQVAAKLVRIATKLQNSKRPDRSLVAAELKSLVRKIAAGEIQYFSGSIEETGYDQYTTTDFEHDMKTVKGILGVGPVWAAQSNGIWIISKSSPTTLDSPCVINIVDRGSLLEDQDIGPTLVAAIGPGFDKTQLNASNWKNYASIDEFATYFSGLWEIYDDTVESIMES